MLPKLVLCAGLWDGNCGGLRMICLGDHVTSDTTWKEVGPQVSCVHRPWGKGIQRKRDGNGYDVW